MFDNYVFTEGSFRNLMDGNKVIGYELESLITYYRGIPCSMIHDVKVKVDQVDVPRESIRFSPNGEDYFTLDELETLTSYKWEYGESGHIRVMQEGGLASGEHEVSLTTMIRVAYIPVPFGGTKVRKIII